MTIKQQTLRIMDLTDKVAPSFLSYPRYCCLVLFTFLMLSFSTEASTVPYLLDRVVGVVVKVVITWSELDRAMEFETGVDFRNLSEADKKKFFKDNEANFLETLIDKRLQLQAAKKLDISVSSEEVREAIEGIKKKYNLSDENFQASLKAEGMTIDEYRKRLSEQIILSKVVNQQVRSKIIVSEEEIDDYISKNRGSSYRIRQILIKKIKDRDKDAMMAKAQDALRRIRSGEDFSAVAFSLSEDSSAKNGGDLGLIKKELLGREFLDVLSRMNVGDVSEPFWTDRGIHIIKLDEKVEAKTQEEMRELARKKIFENKFNEAYKAWIRSLREKAFIEVRL